MTHLPSRFFALLEHVAVKRLLQSFSGQKSTVFLPLGKFTQLLKDGLGRDLRDLVMRLPFGHVGRKGGAGVKGQKSRIFYHATVSSIEMSHLCAGWERAIPLRRRIFVERSSTYFLYIKAHA